MNGMSETIHVLHVDDDPDLTGLVADMLEREDDRLAVETATSADAGLDRLAAERFDCVVSDYDMPGQDGIDFLERVREEHDDLPFILFTGKGSEEVASDAIAAGVTDYLQKGAGTDQYALLANRVENAVEAYRARERAERHERVNELIRTIDRKLVEADTVVDIEEGVCETLTASESYRFAWVGEPDPETGEVVPRTSAGDADAYLEEVTVRYDDSPEGQGPGGRTVRTHEVHVSQDISGDPGFDPWRGTPEQYGFHSVAVLPLVHDGTLHGILPVYADSPHAFDEEELEVLEELAGTVSGAIKAAKTRRRLQEREAQLRRRTRAMDEAPVGISMSDPSQPDNPLVYVNDGFETMTGYDEDDALGRNCRFLQGPDTDADRVAELRAAIDAERPVTVELRNYRADGTEFWNRVTVAPIEDDDGTVVNYVGFQEDVTDRKERERAIEGLHDTVQELLTADTDERIATVTVDALQDILDMPTGAVHLYDDDADALPPVAWTDHLSEVVGTPPTFERGEGLAWEVFETGDARVYDDVSTASNRFNAETDVRSQVIVPLGDHGVLLVGSTEVGAFDGVDVSLARTLSAHATEALDRIERDDEREATVDSLRTLYDVTTNADLDFEAKVDRLLEVGCERLSLPYGFLTRIEVDGESDDGTQTVVQARGDHDLLQPGRSCPLSEAYCRKTIETDGLLAIQDADEAGWSDDPARERFDLGCYVGGKVVVDGELYGTLCFASPDPRDDPFSDAERTFVRLVSQWVGYELERRQAVAELERQNERLEEFASIVSHDLRNPLNVAQGRLEIVAEECDSDQIAAVEKAHGRMEVLIEDVLALARQGDRVDDVEAIALRTAVEESWGAVETTDADLVVETGQTVRADRSRLRQLFENLFRNAVEHAGPDVTVAVGDLGDGDGFYVEDDGPGIPEDERDRVFETGHSTTDEGTGFGLAIVQQTAEAHGWTINVAEGDAGGARFEVTGVEFA